MSDTCACYIIKRNGDPLTTADYDKDSPHAPSRIDLCPLHAAAPVLLAALEKMVVGCAYDHIKGHSGTDCFHCEARAAIRQAKANQRDSAEELLDDILTWYQEGDSRSRADIVDLLLAFRKTV